MQWKRFSYIIFIIRTSSQTFCRLTATSFLQRHTSRKELHRWRRTGRGQTPVLFRQTISQGIILQLKIKIKKEERERKKREKQTKPNRANKSAQNKNIPLGLSIRRRKWRENTRTERDHRSGAGVRLENLQHKPSRFTFRSDPDLLITHGPRALNSKLSCFVV